MSGVSAGHFSAPARWRKILHTQRGPFEGWKVLVVVADAKKRAAYKRLLIYTVPANSKIRFAHFKYWSSWAEILKEC